MRKRYILLQENGNITISTIKPDEGRTNQLHGWCELLPTKNNAVVLEKALNFVIVEINKRGDN